MDIEQFRDYCLSLPHATEDFPFDETTLAFRVMGKIFAMVDLEDTDWLVLKCDPDYAVALRDAWPDIGGAWHMNKKYWNQLRRSDRLPDGLVRSLVRHSYGEVVRKLPRKLRAACPELEQVERPSDRGGQ